MKSLSKISIAAGMMLLAFAVAAPPAQAQCADFPLRSNGEFLVSNPNWAGGGGAETCPIRGCYDSQTDGGPISENIQGFFWALGAGNPEAGLGNDSGSFAAADWTKAAVLPGLPAGTYYYPGFLTLDDGSGAFPNYYPGSTPNWTSGPVDGCITNGTTVGPNGRPCECLFLIDQWGDSSYFLLVGDEVDANIGADFASGTPGPGGDRFGINSNTFEPLPRPPVVSSSRGGGAASFTLNLPAVTHRGQSECNCVAGYRVYSREVLTDELVNPVDLGRGGWTERSATVGAGEVALTDIPCAAGEAGVDDTRLAVAVALELADGFVAPVVSQPQFLQCDPNVAEPNRPGRRPFDPRPEKGRDSERPSRRGGR